MVNKNTKVQIKIEAEDFLNNRNDNLEYQFLSEAIERKNKNQTLSNKQQQKKQKSSIEKEKLKRKTNSSVKENKLKYFQCNRCNKMCLTKKDIIQHLKNHDKEIYKCTKCDRAFASKNSLTYHMKSHAGIKYECDICKRQFNDKSNMKKHKNIHLNIKPYKCKKCPKAFSDPTGFKQHMEQHAGVRFKCKFCRKSYSTRRSLKTHLESHLKINTKQFPCDECEDTFERKHHLEEHLNKFHLEKYYECVHCSKVVYLKTQLVSHMRNLHSDTYKCTDCNKRFSSFIHLNNHIETWHEHNIVPCVHCGKIFRSRYLLKEHKLRLHPIVKPHVCKVCGASFGRLKFLGSHIRYNHSTVRHSCTKCEYTAKNKLLLYYHMQRTHRDPNNKDDPSNFYCATCMRMFHKKVGLEDHIRAEHLKTELFHCDQCEYSTYRSYGIQKHKRNHPVMKYHCKHCSEKFTDVELFRIHLSNHLVKPLQCNDHKWKDHVAQFEQLYRFECNTCKERFTYLKYLKTHINKYHSDQNLKCDYCESYFSIQNDLRQHIERVHLAIKYQCTNCCSYYTTKRSLSNHIKRDKCYKLNRFDAARVKQLTEDDNVVKKVKKEILIEDSVNL